MIKVVVSVIVGMALTSAILVRVSQEENQEKNTSSSSESSGISGTSSAQTSGAQGSYVDYSGDVIAQTAGTKLLFFHAPWCPQCRALEADIKAKGVPEGVTIIKVDYDSNQSLRQKYGVTIQTTLVKVDDSGKLIEKYVAYDEPTLQAIKENLL